MNFWTQVGFSCYKSLEGESSLSWKAVKGINEAGVLRVWNRQVLFLNLGMICYGAVPWPSAEDGKAEGGAWKAPREAGRIENTAIWGQVYEKGTQDVRTPKSRCRHSGSRTLGDLPSLSLNLCICKMDAAAITTLSGSGMLKGSQEIMSMKTLQCLKPSINICYYSCSLRMAGSYIR